MDEFHGDRVSNVKAYDCEDGDQGLNSINPDSAIKIFTNNPSDVIFRQLFDLRMKQMKQGVDLSNLTRVQWGLASLKFSHHIVLKKSTFKEVPVIFQVTVCSACSAPEEITEAYLGVYGDQESALLVSDVHEILNGRYTKLSILRREDAMFFHHLTARQFDESEGVLLPPAPVLSVLEKLRIESASSFALTAEALEEKKRKRSTSIDILIQSSLYLSMTSRESLSSSDEAELKEEEGDGNNAEEEGEYDGEEEEEATGEVDGYDETCLYSSSSNYHNHAPFSATGSSFPSMRSNSPLSEETYTMTSMESRSMHISDSDADSSVFDDSMNAMASAAAAHSALSTFTVSNTNNNTHSQSQSPYLSQSKDDSCCDLHQMSRDRDMERVWDTSRRLDQQQHQQHTHTASYFETPEELPRTRRTNRPRANTFSVSSQRHSSQSLFDAEAERTPLGMITWLASLEEDDFVAAKLLAELGTKDKEFEVHYPNNCDIPKYRGSRSFKEIDIASVLSEVHKRRAVGMEPPTQRRRRANSVIEVNRQIKGDSPLFDEGSFDHGSGFGTGLGPSGRNPRTYRKDPNWASEGRSRGYVGAYSPAERRRRIERFLEKRRLRVWQKNVKYDVRKNFADSRVRVKGRFVKKEDQIALIALGVHPMSGIRDRNRSNSDCSSDTGDREKDRDGSDARSLCVDELEGGGDEDDNYNNSGGDRGRETDRESQDESLIVTTNVKLFPDFGGSNSNSQHMLPHGTVSQGNGTEVFGLGRTRRSAMLHSQTQR